MLKVAQSMQLCILQLVRQLTSEFAPSSLDCLLADLFDIPGLLKSKTKICTEKWQEKLHISNMILSYDMI